MAGKFFNLISHKGLIKTQHEDDDFLRLTLLIGLQALLTTYMSIMILFFSNLNRAILSRIERHANAIDIVLSNPLIAIPISFIVSFLIAVILESKHVLYFNRSFKEEYDYIKSSFMVELEYEYNELSEKELEKIISGKLRNDLIKVYFMGILVGLYSVIFYFLITFTIYVFLLMILITIFGPTTTAFLAGLISTGLSIMRITVVKSRIKEREIQEIDPHADYAPSERQLEIMQSEEPPIICSACRSYIAASSKFCRVCGEEIII